MQIYDVSVPVNYQFVADRLDIASYIDYLVVELYAGNDDWPNNNWIAARERVPEGVFRFYTWDSEGTFGGSVPGLTNLPHVGIRVFPFWGVGEYGGGLRGDVWIPERESIVIQAFRSEGLY